MKISKIKAPNTFLFILILTCVIAALTWIIPGGEYIPDPDNDKVRNFQFISNTPQGIWAILTAPIRGFIKAADIIGFVLIVGGAFGAFQKTEALEAAIRALVFAYKNNRLLQIVILPFLITIFSLGGAVFGMSEEVIPFILIFIPLALALGYDSITGVAIAYVGAHTGFAAAFLNPFTLGIAQGIAEVNLFSGIGYRFFVWIIFTSIAVIYITRYAKKIKSELDDDKVEFNQINSGDQERLDLDSRHIRVLLIFILSMGILVFGVLRYEWYIKEISALFLVMGIVVGIAGKLKTDEIASSFLEGAKDLIGTALIIGLARGVLIVAQDGDIIDTILFYLSSVINNLHPIVAGQAMFVVQTFINFFIPSGSGQAALTMPIMAPLADLTGVTRQTAVLAFQFGDGFSNMIIPTSPVLMGVLALAKISYETWVKWIFKLQIIFFITGCLLLIPPYFMGW